MFSYVIKKKGCYVFPIDYNLIKKLSLLRLVGAVSAKPLNLENCIKSLYSKNGEMSHFSASSFYYLVYTFVGVRIQ